ncbi:TetR/AcrR family transcriptional regulator [Mycobacterium sp. Y57]|uniref:TetR/AcrR family transcriptional regulator n=1 Tax=Mycolicibacterium xanthum TaxID=2796469 RepID=UPI001C864CF2|nr:TetR/AcrR family transcriptional regulator [Mycolicibacterium xanthum]MBX7434238.1 TetR/AcrR family transcriptional regulator [Mycolicibacterium xanthum]
MAGVASRESFFDTGLDVLSDLGYGGLKLAEVCQRLGVTSGSFYHYFASWSVYTNELVAHWYEGLTVNVVEAVQAEPDPRKRIDSLIHAGLLLPHGAEAAIRVWSAIDPEVRAVQAEVDRQRHDAMYQCALEILATPRQAELFAAWAVYLLVGYEQTLLPMDTAGLSWIAEQLLAALDGGRFASVPADE